MDNFSYVGVDTVRFSATRTDLLSVFDDDPSGMPYAFIFVNGGALRSSKVHDCHFVFEFSAKRFYGMHEGFLGGQDFITTLVNDYGARFMRIDLAAQVHDSVNISIEEMSYCLFYGRRSLQKTKEPWAYWPSKSKTVKFYDKYKMMLSEFGPDNPAVFDPVRDCKIRFEIEYRGRASISQILKDGLVLDYASFYDTFLHLFEQITPKLDYSGFTRHHFAVYGQLCAGVPISEMTYRDARLAKTLLPLIKKS